MTSIDWSIAPHWAQAVVTTEHGNDMYWVEGWGCRISKRQRVGNLRPDLNTCDMTKLDHAWRLVERRPVADEAKEPVIQWNGQEGLPPVGVECEYRHMIWPEYRRCEIRYISDESLVAYDNGQEQYYRTRDMLFRPLPTPSRSPPRLSMPCSATTSTRLAPVRSCSRANRLNGCTPSATASTLLLIPHPSEPPAPARRRCGIRVRVHRARSLMPNH